MTVKIRVLSLIATAMFSTVTAQYNALNNLTDTYYPKDKNYSVYICAVCIP